MKVNVWHDDMTESPCEWGCWRVVSFSHRHSNFTDPDEIDFEELKQKIKSGRAFWLDCFQHGNCIWSLHGDGPQCRWDTAQKGGILFLEDNDARGTYNELRRMAAKFLEIYTQWCNGECYGYDIKDEDGELIDSLAGIIGMDDLIQTVKDAIGDQPFEILTTRTMVERNWLGEQVAGKIEAHKKEDA